MVPSTVSGAYYLWLYIAISIATWWENLNILIRTSMHMHMHMHFHVHCSWYKHKSATPLLHSKNTWNTVGNMHRICSRFRRNSYNNIMANWVAVGIFVSMTKGMWYDWYHIAVGGLIAFHVSRYTGTFLHYMLT